NMGTFGGNLCLDTRCNYYNQTHFWRQAIGFCMKKDGDICLVAPGSARCWAASSTDTAPVAIALDASVRLVGPRGERVIRAAEQMLLGNRLTPELCAAAAQAAWKPAKPLDNTDMAHGYRKKMSRVYVERALRMLAEP